MSAVSSMPAANYCFLLGSKQKDNSNRAVQRCSSAMIFFRGKFPKLGGEISPPIDTIIPFPTQNLRTSRSKPCKKVMPYIFGLLPASFVEVWLIPATLMIAQARKIRTIISKPI